MKKEILSECRYFRFQALGYGILQANMSKTNFLSHQIICNSRPSNFSSCPLNIYVNFFSTAFSGFLEKIHCLKVLQKLYHQGLFSNFILYKSIYFTLFVFLFLLHETVTSVVSILPHFKTVSFVTEGNGEFSTDFIAAEYSQYPQTQLILIRQEIIFKQ